MNLPTLCPPPNDAARFGTVQLKAVPEDFVVEEIPLYEPSGSGTHTYVWIEKRKLNTLEAVRRLATALKKRSSDAGLAGLKDAQAVSRQWLSFEHVKESREALAAFNTPELRVLKVSAHGNKLKLGHARGNRFLIRLRQSNAASSQVDALAAHAREALSSLRRHGMPNYFGPQRFGWGGNNSALGKLLVQGNESEFAAACGEKFGKRPPDRKLRNLLVNAFQSELFNQVLARRMPEIGRLQSGDLAWLHRNGAVFRVATATDAAREQPRADNFEISPSGPLFGPKMIAAEGIPGEIESAVLAAAGVTANDFGRKEAEKQPGARRPLRVPFLDQPEISSDPDGVLLNFALPPGSYASIVVREILGRDMDAD